MAALAACLLIAIPTSSIGADNLEIKLASILPQGTPQHFILKKLDEDWRRASGGTVRLRLVDGQSDGEAGIVRKMNANVYHAGMLSLVGMSEIEETVSVMQKMPLAFQSWEEVDYVREKIRPQLEQKLNAKGYIVLFWADAGWVNFISRQKGLFPNDFKKMKMFTWAGDNKAVELMKGAGYQPVALETVDILPSFSTKMIDMAPMPPLFALGAQINTVTEHLLDIKWVPIVGATIIKKQTWDKIPVEMQKKLIPLAEQAGEKMRTEGRKANDESIRTMKSRGMNIHEVSPEAQVEWNKLRDEVGPKIRGNMVPAGIYDEVQRLLKEFHTSKAAAK